MNKPCNIKRIVSVDSHTFDQWLLKEHVRGFGIAEEIELFQSGEKALAYLAEVDEMPEVILLDLHFNDMSCYTFLDRFEEFPAEKKGKTCIIIQSSKVAMELEQVLFTIPLHPEVVAVTVKPFTQFTLHSFYTQPRKGHRNVA